MLATPLTSQPEDVAKEIWQTVQKPQAEIVVGLSAIATTAHRLFPGVTNSLMQQNAK